MLFKIGLFIAGLFLIPLGWHEAKIAYKFQEPVKMTCQQFQDAAEKPSWVSVDDCVVYLGQYESLTNEKTGSITSMAVMLFTSNETAEDEKTTSSLVLKIADSAKRKAIKDNLDKLNAIGETNDPAKIAELLARNSKIFEKGPLVLKEDSDNSEFNLLKPKLAAKHTTYEYSSKDDKSSILKGVLMMLGGLALCAGVAASFFLGKK